MEKIWRISEKLLLSPGILKEEKTDLYQKILHNYQKVKPLAQYNKGTLLHQIS